MQTYYRAGKIIQESLPFLLFVTLLALTSGQVLQSQEHIISQAPIFLVVLPAFVNLAGDLAAVLVARLTTALHVGTIKPTLSISKPLRNSLLAVISVSIIGFVILGLGTVGLSPLIGIPGPFFIKTLLVIFISGIITTIIVIIIGLIVALFAFRRGWDPDNITGPLVTTFGDLIGTVTLFTIILLIGV